MRDPSAGAPMGIRKTPRWRSTHVDTRQILLHVVTRLIQVPDRATGAQHPRHIRHVVIPPITPICALAWRLETPGGHDHIANSFFFHRRLELLLAVLAADLLAAACVDSPTRIETSTP